MGSRGESKALDAQERARQEAMAWEQEQARRAEEMYRQRYGQWMAGRNALLQRYGISLPEAAGMGGPPQGAPGAIPRPGMMRQGPPMAQGAMQQRPTNLAELIRGRPNMGFPGRY